MPDPLSFLPYHTAPLDWSSHDRDRARARLAASAGAARARRLRTGACRFMPDRPLVEAINAAIASRSPLLLTGEPGTGKTQVGYYLAEYFGIPLFHYQVHSESTARDLRYDFDAVAYLRDAYLAALDPGGTPGARPPPPARTDPRYLQPGRLWQAYVHDGECVLLIDEIDKAPRDFPNDLLQELADYRFDHPFPPHPPIARGPDQPPPLIVITSNGERRLPDPFLRRAIVHHIELDPDLLGRILGAWQDAFPALPPPVQGLALQRFWEVRTRLERQGGRPPGAAEFLIWLTVLAATGATAPDLQAPGLADLPARHCLVKDHEDLPHLST